ncbi:MAG: hypothetical protein PF569_04960 [Candidatus Woesearchaeota archaeon]|jgi:hypothetical protein|nr:hypothetical protein [Candidatus Woesearchaeota archaeon]
MVKNQKIKISGYLFLFLICFIIINFSFNFVYNHYTITPHKDKVYSHFISENTLEYLFLGDSHTYMGLNPEFISNTSFNYAFPGESYAENYYRLKRIVEKDRVIPEIVFLEIDGSMNENIDLFQRSLYLIRNDVSYAQISEDYGFSVKSFINYNFGFIGRGIFFGYVFLDKNKLDSINAQGFFLSNGVLNNNTFVIDYKMDSKVDLISLDRILKLSKKNEIGVIFIKYPHNVRLNLNDSSVKEYYLSIGEVVRDNNINFTIFDYSETYMDNDSLFFDLDHLNYIGAEIFSKDLNKRIDELKINN